jgi:hypothetical protein
LNSRPAGGFQAHVADLTDSSVLGAIWGFTRPFERISRFWRIDFIPKPQNSACFENCVKSDSRRLHHFSLAALVWSPATGRRARR